jgi:hypothetical protein
VCSIYRPSRRDPWRTQHIGALFVLPRRRAGVRKGGSGSPRQSPSLSVTTQPLDTTYDLRRLTYFRMLRTTARQSTKASDPSSVAIASSTRPMILQVVLEVSQNGPSYEQSGEGGKKTLAMPNAPNQMVAELTTRAAVPAMRTKHNNQTKRTLSDRHLRLQVTPIVGGCRGASGTTWRCPNSRLALRPIQ